MHEQVATYRHNSTHDLLTLLANTEHFSQTIKYIFVALIKYNSWYNMHGSGLSDWPAH